MKIKIAHLYYDLLNLYGEQGNVLALKKAFTSAGTTVQIDLLTINEKWDFTKYDIFYIGTGSEENLLLVLEDIKKHQKGLKEAIKKGKYFIATGNAHELFGKFIEMNNQKYLCLDFFDYYAKQNLPKRIAGESFMEFSELEGPIIGFQNRTCVLQINNDNHLFGVINGHADNFKASHEGYRENNFIGTYLLGPLLIRNPHLTDYIVKNIITSKNKEYEEKTDTNEYKAYHEYIKNFYD